MNDQNTIKLNNIIKGTIGTSASAESGKNGAASAVTEVMLDCSGGGGSGDARSTSNIRGGPALSGSSMEGD